MIAILFAFLSLAYADFPPNNAFVPVDDAVTYRVSESAFADAIRMVDKAMSEEVALKAGCTLSIANRWSSGIVNAYASRSGGTCFVEMHGGFARYGGMSKGAVLGVLCHEVGHHIGGRPRYSGSVMSCEGQSDYFAQECLQKLMSKASAKTAGFVLGQALASLSGSARPSYSTPDRYVSPSTYCSHPNAQCRLDTYLAGLNGAARPRCWYGN